ncbi:hypothetical protein ACFPRL_04240 [Pseudoclavibacter helvolus]
MSSTLRRHPGRARPPLVAPAWSSGMTLACPASSQRPRLSP